MPIRLEHHSVLALAASLTVAALTGAAPVRAPQTPSFDYRDVERFGAIASAVDAGASPDSAFAAYMEQAGTGLRTWATTYGLTPARYVAAYRRYPGYLRYVGGLADTLRAREPEIAAGLSRLHALVSDALDRPSLPLPATSYFVTPLGGGGSARPGALLIGIDHYGNNPGAPLEEFASRLWPDGPVRLQSLEGLVFVTAHELAHSYQQIAMGASAYTRMYRSRDQHDTMLARAVREGCAEFLGALATGRSTPDHVEYGREHEVALWRTFRGLAFDSPDRHPGWFSGVNPDAPKAPQQIGYFVGMRMCRAYYESMQDRKAAVRAIVQAHSPEELELMMRAYDAALGPGAR